MENARPPPWFPRMHATRGKDNVFSDANEFIVRGWKAMKQGQDRS